MCFVAVGVLPPPLSAQTEKTQPASKPNSPLVTALWLSHNFASVKALTPGKDRQLKETLTAALGNKPAALTWEKVSEVFDKDAFQKLAGAGNKIDLEKMERLLLETTPASRHLLFPKVRGHMDLLTSQFDLIEAPQRESADQLVSWIAKNYKPDEPLSVVIICTGNSRRSILGSTLGNIAASYYGMPNVRFYSGGTTPSAFNPRTIATLKEIGVDIEATGKEAARGDAGDANPIYQVSWGKGQQSIEFSKKYSDAPNPSKNFAAVLVCSEADTSCPVIAGASVRIPTSYLDPRLYDGAPFEAAKYAERRDDIGRFMLTVMMQSRRRVNVDLK